MPPPVKGFVTAGEALKRNLQDARSELRCAMLDLDDALKARPGTERAKHVSDAAGRVAQVNGWLRQVPGDAR